MNSPLSLKVESEEFGSQTDHMLVRESKNQSYSGTWN